MLFHICGRLLCRYTPTERVILARGFLDKFEGPLPLYSCAEIKQIHKDVYSGLEGVLTEGFNRSKTRIEYALICRFGVI